MQRTFFAPALICFGLLVAACSGKDGNHTLPMPTMTAPATATAGDAKQAVVNGQTIWVDATSGLALYYFTNDGPNISNCIDGCTAIWPPHAAHAGEQASGNFTIFTRPGGTLQWAYKTRPLYTFVGDTVAKNATGNGFQSFFVATP